MTDRTKRLLIVEPGPDGSRAWRESLQDRHPSWRAGRADSVAAALGALGREPHDAMIVDLQATALDGPTLLASVRDQHPSVVRLALSGAADDEPFLRAMPLTHQFLGKPCNVELLFELLDRACGLRSILQDEVSRRLVGQLRRLPSMPQTFQALTNAISQPNAHAADISEIVSRDTGLAVKTLQIVNSAFFARHQPISSVQAAVTYLGLEMLKSLALSACLFTAGDGTPNVTDLLANLQVRSVRRARIARMLMSDARGADDAFTAALLLDVGQAVLALGAPEQFERMVAAACANARPWHEVEPEFFGGVAHPEVGAFLLGLWGLPLNLIEVVAYHHAPSHAAPGDVRMLAAVHVADAITEATAEHSERLMEWLDTDFVGRMPVSRYLQAWNIGPESHPLGVEQRLRAEHA